MSERRPETAVLLAAGRGRRLRPFTDRTPKPLLPVNGRPTLDFVLTAVAFAGISRVCLVTHHLAEQIEAYVGDGSAWGLTAVTCRQPALLGTAHGLQTAVRQQPELFASSRPFLLTATDYLLPELYLADLVAAHTQNGADISLSLKAMTPDAVRSRSSVALAADGRVTRIVEKPAPGQAPSHLVASLTYLLPTAVTGYLDTMTPSPRGEYELPSILNRMIDDGYVVRGLQQPPPPEWEPPPITL